MKIKHNNSAPFLFSALSFIVLPPYFNLTTLLESSIKETAKLLLFGEFEDFLPSICHQFGSHLEANQRVKCVILRNPLC